MTLILSHLKTGSTQDGFIELPRENETKRSLASESPSQWRMEMNPFVGEGRCDYSTNIRAQERMTTQRKSMEAAAIATGRTSA